MAFGWLKNLFGKKNKGGNAGLIESVYENPFYESGDNEAVNPFYQEEDTMPARDSGASMYNSAAPVNEAAAPAPEAAVTRREVVIEPGNLLENIGGMPTRESIKMMAGGTVWKSAFFKEFNEALNALERYQVIMATSRTYQVNEAELRRTGKTDFRKSSDVFDGDAVDEAFEELSSFVIHANQAITGPKGFFAGHSNTVRRLSPIFANLIAQANGLLPKLAYLENAVAPYILATDHETYTFSDVITHEATGGRSGGLATRNMEGNSGSVEFKADEVLEILSSDEDNSDKINTIRDMRQQKTEQARMNMLIPVLPAGVLNGGGRKDAEAIADAYIKELSLLMTALDDTAESYEKFGNQERSKVHDKNAEQFRMSRLLYRVTQSKELLIQVILHGMPKEATDQNLYKDLIKIASLGGSSLSSGVALVNAEAQDPSTFARLVDKDGKALEEKKDYIIGGGAASVSVLDFVNKQVLRAPNDLTKETEKTALNGIKDEATGKISDFLGLHVSARAEAAGFVSKNKKGEEQAFFGGSIMELAQGSDAGRFNLLLGSGQEEHIASKRKGDKYQNVDVFQNGRLLGDYMKLEVLDYLILHGDRNSGNYMINMNAKEGESMVTAIDNDFVLGVDWSGRSNGEKRSAEALQGIKGRASMDFGTTLEAVFPVMTQEIKDLLEKIDLQAFNEMLLPYADRVTRLAVVHRASELKELAKKVPTCDLSSPEGVQEYLNLVIRTTMTSAAKKMYLDQSGSLQGESKTNRFTPNKLIRNVLSSYAGTDESLWGSDAEVIMRMKVLGISRAEAKDIFMKNLSTSKDSDEAISEELFSKSTLAKIMVDYDLPLDEFRKKYVTK